MKIHKIYMDACCYIDLVRGDELDEYEHPNCAWLWGQVVRAALKKDIELWGSTLLMLECTYLKVGHADRKKRLVTDSIKGNFSAMLMSGRVTRPVFPNQPILKIAHDLAWNGGIYMGAVDAIHIATAVAQKCEVLVTNDKKMLDMAETVYNFTGVKIITGQEDKTWLPGKYLQEEMAFDETGKKLNLAPHIEKQTKELPGTILAFPSRQI